MKKTLLALAILSSAASFSVLANSMPMAHQSDNNQSAMQTELNNSMMKMHDDMAASAAITNPDAAFAEGMIAHHKGAIDMAQIELKYGKDPEMRKLAEAIINAQGPEIEQMQKWLDKNKK